MSSTSGADDSTVGRFGLTAPAPMVRVAYVIPSNRTPQPEGVESLQHSAVLFQSWYREQMQRNGFGAKTFLLETETDGVTPKIHVVQVSQTDADLRPDVWENVLNAATQAGVPVWAPGQVWLLVPEIHQEHADGVIVGGTALGAGGGSGSDGGVAMIGSNGLAFGTIGSLLDNTLYAGTVIPEIGPYPLVQSVSCPWFEGETISSVSSSYHGAALHELTHAFGLPHDFRNDANFHGDLMGNGLRGFRGAVYPDGYPQDDTWLSHGQALALSSSRYLNPLEHAPESDRPQVSVTTSGSVAPVGGQVQVSFTATDASGLSSAILMEGGNQVGEIALAGTTVSTVLRTPYYTTGQTSSFTVAVSDIYGNRTAVDTTITVAAGSSHAPEPFVTLSHSTVSVNESVVLDTSRSTDPDGLAAAMQVEWDLDGDGTFETLPSTNRTLTTSFSTVGDWLICARITDASGLQAVSEPIAIHVAAGRAGLAEISVLDGTADIANHQATPIDLGMVALQAAGPSKTFTIRNDGSETLRLATPFANAGHFTVGQPGKTSLVPNETTTFTVTLNTAAVWSGSEQIVIGSNDGDNGEGVENPFTFSVSGTVLAPLATISSVSVKEGNTGITKGTFTVTLPTRSANAITLRYATQPGTATSGSDYIETSGTVTFPAGQITKTISVAVKGDRLFENPETFTLVLTDSAIATVVAQATGTIVNDDKTPAVSIRGIKVREGTADATVLTFDVTLSGASGLPVTVGYSTADGTARSDTDYAATSGHLIIPAGQTGGTVTVLVRGDTLYEANETFAVSLSNPQGATLAKGKSTATASILNDDAAPTVSIGDATLVPDAAGLRAEFTVTLSAPSGVAATVKYSTVSGTARRGRDFKNLSGTLLFPAGQTTMTVSVPILDDPAARAGKTFFVQLSSPKQATLGGQTRGTCTIHPPDSTWTSLVDSSAAAPRSAARTNVQEHGLAVDEALCLLMLAGGP